jgi:hypothetical protein
MQKRSKDLLRAVVTQLRHILSGGLDQRGDLDRELERLGVGPDGTIAPYDALLALNLTSTDLRARRAAEAQVGPLPPEQRAAMRAEVVERAAYSWINRLLALRAMEARGLIDEVLRANPAYDGASEALFILRHEDPERVAGPDGGWWAVIENACRGQAADLPGLFDLSDPNTALRPSTPALLACIAAIGSPPAGYTLEEADAAFADPDAIGWAYQFYQEEAKARTYAKLNDGGKVSTRAEIASATQLFTEPYMVKWLLQNSLGRSYHELYPDSQLPAAWDYYIRPDSDSIHNPQSEIRNLSDLTLMDPCMGSGHFLREAFDMFAAMYREQEPGLGAAEIAGRILAQHLHGIDIDPRAAQLAALTLYLRAWELVRDERRAQRQPGPGSYRPPALNPAATPTGLTPGALERHLQRHPEDAMFRPLLAGIFAALEHADILGSLLQPGKQIDEATAAFRRQQGKQLALLAEDADLNRLLEELGKHDPAQLRRLLVERVGHSFAAEAGDADVASSLFGHEACEALRLVELLDQRYVVVATNPPYMGSGNMARRLREYVDYQFEAGKRDLYTAFILRCLSFCHPSGIVAMVTLHGWMFNRSYAALRSATPERPDLRANPAHFEGLLRTTTIQALAHLGRYAFSEIGNAVVAPVLFIVRSRPLLASNWFWACRLIAPRPSDEQAQLLKQAVESPVSRIVFKADQAAMLRIPETPVVYWAPPSFYRILNCDRRISDVADVRRGLDSGEDKRFVRWWWEVHEDGWKPYSKGGGYSKWAGLDHFVIDWRCDQVRYRDTSGARVQNTHYYFLPFLTYSLMARGSLGVRFVSAGSIPGGAAGGIYPANGISATALAAYLNARATSYVLRFMSPDFKFREGYVANVPNFLTALSATRLSEMANLCRELKSLEISRDLTERSSHYPT